MENGKEENTLSGTVTKYDRGKGIIRKRIKRNKPRIWKEDKGRERLKNKLMETQKNGSTPLANTNSRYQLKGVLPSDIIISDLVKNINIFNYNI